MALREVSSAEIVNGLSHLSNFSDDKGSTTIAVLSNSDSVISREVRDSYVQRFRRLDTQPAITYLSVLFRQMIEDSILSVDRNPIDGNHEFSDVVLDFEHNILSQISNNELGRAAHVGKQFLFRQLGRKAFKLSRPLLDVGAPPFLEKGSSGYDAIDQALRDRTFEEFKQAMVKRDWRKNLEGKIIREATDIYHLLRTRIDDLSFDLPISNEPQEMTIVSSTIINEEDRLRVGYVINEITESRKEKWHILPEGSLASELFANYDDEIIFYTDQEWREIVFCAIERVLFREIRIEQTVPVKSLGSPSLSKYGSEQITILFRGKFDRNEMARVCGIRGDILDEITSILSASGDYDTLPCIVPVDGDTAKLLVQPEKAFRDFVGESGYKVDGYHLKNFVSQFPPNLRFDLIQLLNHFEMVTRESLTNFIMGEAIELTETEKRHVVMVPFSRSSGKLIRGYIGDVSRKNVTIVDDIGAAYHKCKSLNGSSSILLFDDNMMSGKQSADQLRTWFEPSHTPSDDRVDQSCLPEDQRALLQTIPMNFAFYIADEVGRRNLAGTTKELRLNSTKAAIRFKKDAEEISGENYCSPALREFLKDVGKQLYIGKMTGVDADNGSTNSVDREKLAENRALGFDNYEGVFCFPHNAPTSLYTAMWCPGRVKLGVETDFAWLPLFVRNNSLIHYVLR